MAWEHHGAWYSSIYEGGEKKFLRFSTQQDAEIFEKYSGRKRKRREYPDGKRIGENLEYLVGKASLDARIRADRNLARLMHALGYVAKKQADDLLAEDFTKIIAHWRTTYRHHTVYLYWKMLKRVLRLLGREHPFLDRLGQTLPRMGQPRARSVTVLDADFDALYSWDGTPDCLRPFLLLAREDGLRFAEALSIRPRDVTDGIARFIQKGGNERDQSLTDRILTWAKKCPDPDLRFVDQLGVFRDARGKIKPVTPSRVRKWFARAKLELKLPDFQFHDLRRTFGTAIHEKYHDIRITQQALGHKSITSTVVYLKPFEPKKLKGIMEEVRPKLTKEIA